MRLRAPALALFGLLAGHAWAGDVVSPKAEAVAVTVYRDRPMTTAQLAALGENDTHGLALVVETRTVRVPAGRTRLRFEGVADGIVPQSAGVEGLPARVIERNFDYDLLTPANLVAKSVGQTVKVVRTDRRTGRETTETAVLRSGPDGVVLDLGGRIEALRCSGGAERLVFDHAPATLNARPTLSLAINAPTAGRYTLRLAYLTTRMDWSADYIARLAPDGRTLALTGWISLVNRTAASFQDAPTEVVAGHLARVPVEIPRAKAASPSPHCWPGQTTHDGWAARPSLDESAREIIMPLPAPPIMMMRAMTLAAPARKIAIESQLGDYKLYTLAEPTTVASHQTKQVLFLDQPSVAFQKIYAHTVWEPGGLSETPPAPADIVLRIRNTRDQGLGRPLPEGSIQLRQPQAGGGRRELLVGQARVNRDTPVGEPLEIALGRASDVTVIDRLVDTAIEPGVRSRRTFEVRIANARRAPASVEIRHGRAGAAGFKIIAESDPHGDKAGDPLWRLTLPAGGEHTLRYTAQVGRD